MPGAWSQMSFFAAPMPTDPEKEGTIVVVTTCKQKCYLKVYETPRRSENMLCDEGAFAMLSDLGTINGDDVGEVKYAGRLSMSSEDIRLLSEDTHAFEKIVRAMAGAKPYHYVLFMQSYGPTYGNEEPPAARFSDASGPLHVYDRVSTMEDDHWEHWHLTNNYDDPTYGSQSYDINNWYKASMRDWFYKGTRDYSQHLHFRGWALPKQVPIVPCVLPEPNAPEAIEALSPPGPVVMGEVISYAAVEQVESPASRRTVLSCCPFGRP